MAQPRQEALRRHGIDASKPVQWNLAPARLYEESFARKVGTLVHMGALATVTVPHTGRSPKDRFIVRDSGTDATVDWGTVNLPLAAEHFDALRRHFDEPQIVELVAVCALFGFLNRWNDTMSTELEGIPRSFATAHLRAAGWQVGKHAARD